MDLVRKDVIKIFQDVGFKIDIKTNLKVVDFLDATFNLSKGTYKSFKKPNDILRYINTSSNHPPPAIKQLPSSIADGLSKNSSKKEIFDKAKAEYEKSLKDSGYDSVELNYNQNKQRESRRNRNRNIIWFNPPFSRTVSTNVAKRFLNLLDHHFPKTNKLSKIFNRNTIKVSYCCTESMASVIKSHNKKLTIEIIDEQLPCKVF